MSAQRGAIISLYEAGKRQCEIVRLLGISRQLVSSAIKRYDELGHLGDRPGRGRKRTVRTPRLRHIVKQRLTRNPQAKVRKMARDLGVSHSTLQRVVKNELKLTAYKLRKAQRLDDKDKKIRLERCRLLKARSAGEAWKNIVFTDENFFTIEQSHNRQNDRIYSSSRPGATAIIPHRQKPDSVMVWGGICSTGKTPLVFVEKGVKMDQEIYRRDILESVVLPWSQQHFGDQPWTFQQDSAPSHRASNVQQWCMDHFPEFISSKEWPPYSPDLNPMDYSVWSILEARACATSHRSLDALKATLTREWDKISEEEVRKIVENFRKRLSLCIKAKGGYFENK
jgi:AraC-like DNA-binding protein